MDIQEQILQELKTISKALLNNQSDYCDTAEACRIIGVSNARYLSQLFKRNLLPRYNRADGFTYKKTDLYKVAAALDTKSIILEPLNKSKE